MHMRISVVRLMRILRRVVRIHEIGHRAPIHHEVSRAIGLGGDAQSGGTPDIRRWNTGTDNGQLFLGLTMNPRIDLRKLEEIFPVIAGPRMVISGGSEAG